MNDARLGARMLAKTPVSSLTIAGLLALGIGTTTTMFSLFDAILARPLPVKRPDKLVRVVQRRARVGTRSEFSYRGTKRCGTIRPRSRACLRKRLRQGPGARALWGRMQHFARPISQRNRHWRSIPRLVFFKSGRVVILPHSRIMAITSGSTWFSFPHYCQWIRSTPLA